MDLLTSYAYSKKFTAKTDKSFINIMRGHRSHQTYFDAMMQNLLPFYHTRPDLTMIPDETAEEPLALFPYFYDASIMTFQGLRLLTQSIVADKRKFIPVTNHLYIQHQVKLCYAAYHKQQFYEDLIQLFDQVNQYYGHCLSAMMLPSEEGYHPSEQELQRKYALTAETFQLMLLKELNLLTELMVDHPKLHPLYIQVPLNTATDVTYRFVQKGMTVEQIAAKRHVKVHTIEDHIVEILIKDYPLDLLPFINEQEINEIKALYHEYHFEKLKPYFEASTLDSYLKVKLGIVMTMKEVH